MDVRILPPELFGAALQYFTGSKHHNVTLRQRALKQGYTLNEYGLVRMEDEKRVAGKTEEEIYQKAWASIGFRPSCAKTTARLTLREASCRSSSRGRHTGRRAHAYRGNRREVHD